MNRRGYLAAAGSVLSVALAGCGGQSGAIQEVSVTNSQITVSLASGSDADSLLLLANGKDEIDSTEVSAGQEQATLSLEGAGPGTHKIVAATDGSEIDSREVTLEQNYEIRDLQVVEYNPRRDDAPSYAGRIQATIANTGDVPVSITFFGATDGVLTTASPSDGSMGVKLPSEKYPESDVQVTPGSKRSIQTGSMPLRYYRQAHESDKSQEEILQSACEGTTRTAIVEVHTKRGESTTGEVEVTYAGEPVAVTTSLEYGCTEVSIDSSTF